MVSDLRRIWTLRGFHKRMFCVLLKGEQNVFSLDKNRVTRTINYYDWN